MKTKLYTPIQILFNYEHVKLHNPKKLSEFKRVMEETRKQLAKLLLIRRNPAGIVSILTKCGPLEIEPTVNPVADLIVFFRTSHRANYHRFVRGGFCDIDPATFRPTLGWAEVNAVYLEHSHLEQAPWLIAQTLRELVHILGFNQLARRLYQNPKKLLRRIPPAKIMFQQRTAMNHQLFYLKTRFLGQTVKDHFGCKEVD